MLHTPSGQQALPPAAVSAMHMSHAHPAAKRGAAIDEHHGASIGLSATLESGCIAALWVEQQPACNGYGIWLHVCPIGGSSLIGPLLLGEAGACSDLTLMGNGAGRLLALWRAEDGCMRRRIVELPLAAAAPAEVTMRAWTGESWADLHDAWVRAFARGNDISAPALHAAA